MKIPVARGEHVGAVEPGSSFTPRIEFDWDEFVKQVTTFDIRDEKDGPYFCRPMGGDGHRSDKNAGAWPLLPCDLDQLTADDQKALREYGEKQGLSMVIATTFSHTPDAPRIRLWIKCSRDVTAVEHSWLLKALASDFPFKLDLALAKPSQPIFLPACPPHRQADAWAKEYPGRAIDVDRMLQGYKSVIAQREADRAAAAKGIKTGVRVAGGTIDLMNNNFDLRDLLDSHPQQYKRRSRDRYMWTGSKSGRPAVVLYADGPRHSLISFHENDPLSVRNPDGTIRVLDAFAAYAILEHNDNFAAAFEGARRMVHERQWDSREKEKTPPPPLRIISTKQISANLKPRDATVQGMLEKGCITIVTGDSNSGKTTVLQHMALCIASGTPFASHAVKRSRVIWVAGEDAHNAQVRILGLAQKYPQHFDLDALDNWFYILPQRIEIMREDSLANFLEAVDALEGSDDIGAIFLDSKSMVWGGEDENSNDEAAEFIQVTLEKIVKRYNCAVVITHHLTKFKDKEAQSARGASALINNVDHEWRFDKRGNEKIVTMMPGSKLRIAPWSEKHFTIEVINVHGHPHLIDNFGDEPRISVPELTNQAGVSASKIQTDKHMAIVIDVLLNQVVRNNKGEVAVIEIARAMLNHAEFAEERNDRFKKAAGKTAADQVQEKLERGVRDMLERKNKGEDTGLLKVMVTQGLLDPNYEVTEAGRDHWRNTLPPA